MLPAEVVCCGEVLIDMVPLPEAGDRAYVAKAGGAPGNVAVGLARLGRSSAIISKLGDDLFGKMLADALKSNGVATRGLTIASGGEHTMVAIVSLDDAGDRKFTLLRSGSADEALTVDDVDEKLIREAKFLHVGTLGFSTRGSAAATRHAIDTARQSGCLISADPNLRPSVWKDLTRMREAAEEIIRAAAVVKISEEELVTLRGPDPAGLLAREIMHDAMRVIAVTKGERGAVLLSRHGEAEVAAFRVDAVDTTGAGDAFMAALLSSIIARGGADLTSEALHEIGTVACAAGAITASRRGAMESMPSLPEIHAFLRSR